MQINLIAAVGNRGQLGLNGEIPWHEPADLKWFKEMTMGGIVVVGANTAKLLPALPGRFVHVMQRGDTPQSILESEAIQFAKEDGISTLWVAGGAKTYKIWLPFIQRAYISRINYDGPADVYMPQLWWDGGQFA